jgi:hypothetical protein
LCLATEARAEHVGAPALTANDTWTYQNTVENKSGWHQQHVESTVVHAGSSSVAVSNKVVGSTMPPSEQLARPDWSRLRSVNGHETLVARPLSFPLEVGKTWEVEYAEDHPSRQHSSERFQTTYKVVGWQDVTVPAGTFHALKIEGEGEWSAAIAPAVGAVSGTRIDALGAQTMTQAGRVLPSSVSGHIYKEFWYVPAVKNGASRSRSTTIRMA